MKRYLKFILLLAILPVFIKAHEPQYCTKEEFQELYDQVKDVVVAPVLINSTKEYTDYRFRISAPKKPDKPYPAYTDYDKSDKVEYIRSEGIYRLYGKVSTKEKVTVSFRLNANMPCYPEALKTMDYNLLYVNPYAKNKRCSDYPDFKYCGKNTYVDIDDKEADKLFEKYIKKKKNTKAKKADKDSKAKKENKQVQALKKMLYIIKKNVLFIILAIILFIVAIYLLISKKKKKIYLLLFIFLLPNFISANVWSEWDYDTGANDRGFQWPEKPCTKEKQNREIAAWCDCNRMEIDAANAPDNGNGGGYGAGSHGTVCPGHICNNCYGFCNGAGFGTAPDTLRGPISPGETFEGKFGAYCLGRYKAPIDVSGYCCYYKGNPDSKYRYFNGKSNQNCKKPNMRAVYVDDATDCQNSTCNDYWRFEEKEEFCNEYADTETDKNKAKENCISKSGGKENLFCGLPISYEETRDESCIYNSPSNGDHVFSATGRKKNSRVFAYQVPGAKKPTKIYLQENCEYEEDLEMRSSGSSYAFINTLTISNGRSCKYKIYNERNILRNLMATVFRPYGRTLSCDENKYCNAIKKVKEDKLENLLKGNKTDYKTNYTISGKKEGDNNVLSVSQPFQFKGEALKVQSKMLKAKDTGERLNTYGVYGAPTSNFERETTANTGVTMNMKESCYNFPNNVLRDDGTCFPAYFADKGIKQAFSNATFSTSNGFLCGGQVNTSYSYKDNPPVERCPSDGSGSGGSSYGGGHGYGYDNGYNYIKYSPYCEIVIHAKKCDKNPSSNYYDLRGGYRAGLRINPKIKAVNYRIANHCLSRGDVTGHKTSTLRGNKSNTHIYGGVIDEKKNFYQCQKTILHEECIEENCTVTKNGDDYSVSGAGDMEKNGVYVRKGKRFLKHEYQAYDSPKNLKMFRIYENKVNSKKSEHLKYYKDNNLVNMAEPGFRHSIYFMVCDNNNCRNPKLCESPYEPEKDPIPGEEDPDKPGPGLNTDSKKDPTVPDCITDLEHEQMKNAEAVKSYCNTNASKEYKTDGSMEACLNKCYVPDRAADEPQLYRRIKYKEPFPNKRSPGWNWFGREALITKSSAFIKDHDPLWVITLRQSDSYSIRNANLTAGYDPYYDLPELTGDPFQKFESNFLKTNLRDVKRTEKQLGE